MLKKWHWCIRNSSMLHVIFLLILMILGFLLIRILDHNQLTGEIPESLGSLQNLEILWVRVVRNICSSTFYPEVVFIIIKSLDMATGDWTGTFWMDLYLPISTMLQVSVSCMHSVEDVPNQFLLIPWCKSSMLLVFYFENKSFIFCFRYLSNNNLNGSIPDLAGMNLLTYV